MLYGATIVLLISRLMARVEILTREKHELEERIAFLTAQKRQLATLCDRQREQVAGPRLMNPAA